MAYTNTTPKPKASGIDVSTYQGKPDWKKLKTEGVEFAIIRGGYGDAISYPGQIDNTFEYNYKGCKDAGIPVGMYWYSYATDTAMAIQEAKACIRVCKGKQFELPILYDVEESRIFRTGKTNEIIKAWADVMEEAGFFVGIYIYRSALQSYLSKETRTRYALAVAEYGPQLNYDGKVGFWQNGSTFRYKGIGGGATNTDHDFMYEDYPTIIKASGRNGFSKTTPSKPAPAPAPTPVKPVEKKKSNDEIAEEVIDGKWGVYPDRKNRLEEAGYNYSTIQDIVNKKTGMKSSKKSIDEIAKEVIKGEWGVYPDRKWKLQAAGYNYYEVQKRVDELLRY